MKKRPIRMTQTSSMEQARKLLGATMDTPEVKNAARFIKRYKNRDDIKFEIIISTYGDHPSRGDESITSAFNLSWSWGDNIKKPEVKWIVAKVKRKRKRQA